jgi:hypothetical protein
MTEDEHAREAERALLAKAMVENDADVIHVVAQAARMQQSTAKTQTYIIATLGLVFAMLAIMAVATLISVISLQRSTDTLDEVRHSTTVLKKYGKVNKENGALIRDCVTPKGKCYQNNQARTATFRSQLVDAIVFAAECARDPKVEDVKQCALDKIGDTLPP